jgi:ABC-2 type transport system permease protein
MGSSRIGREARVAWAIAVKDVRTYYTRPPSIMFGILFPFSLFLSFSIGRNAPLEAQIPVLLSQTLLFASSSIGPVVIPSERANQTFDRFLTSPVSLQSILLGKTLAGIIYGTAISVIPIILGISLFGSKVASLPALAACIALSSVCFSAMGIMFASIPGQTPGQVMMPLNFVRIPMLFVSGVYIPIGELPLIGQLASLLSPLTHTVELARYAFGSGGFFSPTINLSVLAAYSALFLVIGVRFHVANQLRE